MFIVATDPWILNSPHCKYFPEMLKIYAGRQN